MFLLIKTPLISTTTFCTHCVFLPIVLWYTVQKYRYKSRNNRSRSNTSRTLRSPIFSIYFQKMLNQNDSSSSSGSSTFTYGSTIRSRGACHGQFKKDFLIFDRKLPISSKIPIFTTHNCPFGFICCSNQFLHVFCPFEIGRSEPLYGNRSSRSLHPYFLVTSKIILPREKVILEYINYGYPCGKFF